MLDGVPLFKKAKKSLTMNTSGHFYFNAEVGSHDWSTRSTYVATVVSKGIF